MAIKLPKFLTPTDTKSRLILVLTVVVILSLLIALSSRFLGGASKSTSASRVATAPSGLESVPGGELSPEYYRAVMKANVQASKQAKLSGGSAVPTLMNVQGETPPASNDANNCTVMCPGGDVSDVTDNLNDLVRNNKLAQEDANTLLNLAKNNVSVNEFGAALNNLVKQGKLPPEAARRLYEEYERQHANNLADKSAKMMDGLIASGKLSLDSASQLLALQKKRVTPAEYSAALDQLVKSGKITPLVAAQLSSQYNQQLAEEATNDAIGNLKQMAQNGEISQEIADSLSDMQRRKVPLDQYAAEIERLRASGKLTPAAAAKLLEQYQTERISAAGGTGALKNLVAAAEASAAADVQRMMKEGRLPSGVAKQLNELRKKGASPEEYKAALDDLVRAGKIKPEDADQIMASYQRVQDAKAAMNNELNSLVGQGKLSQEAVDRLANLQQQNVTPEEYKNALNQLVSTGKVSSAAAKELMDKYDKLQAAKENASNNLNSLINSGKLSAEEANSLQDLQRKGASAEEYGNAVEQLVKNGKITREEANQLITNYNQVQTLKKDLGDSINNLTKNAKLSSAAANELNALEKNGASSEDYQNAVNRLVKGENLSSDDTKQLAANYAKAEEAKSALQNNINDLVKQGKISQGTADHLTSLQKAGVSTDEYKKNLDDLVKSGVISQQEANDLLNNYKKVSEADKAVANDLNRLVREGKMSQETANRLAELQHADASPAEYQSALNDLVKAGKLSAEDAERLAANYTRFQAAQAAGEMPGPGVQADINDLVASGKLSKDTADQLMALQRKGLSAKEYQANLEDLVRTGKISPEDATRLAQHYANIQAAETDLDRLVAEGKISPDVGNQLLALQKQGVSAEEYQKTLDNLVKAGKISGEDANKLGAEYQKLQALKDVTKRLTNMQANNASVADYAAELKKAVESGALTAGQASSLLQDYQNKLKPVVAPPTAGLTPEQIANLPPGDADFAKLQANLATEEATPENPDVGEKTFFSTTQDDAKQRAIDERQQRIADTISAMSTQAGNLMAAWQAPTMNTVNGTYESDKEKSANCNGGVPGQGGATSSAGGTGKVGAPEAAPFLKAGTILFAVLDTAVNSDYPDTPVMATIVEGKLKGAKLIGRLSMPQGQDRVNLSFSLMDMDTWLKSRSISAFAIDPDTARTALASEVNHHYLMRYGSMVATSFVQGYANAINTAGSTSTSSVSGITTTHPPFSAQDKLITGIGQVGTTLGTVVQSYVNTPATVKINAGVGLGILFMQDVPA